MLYVKRLVFIVLIAIMAFNCFSCVKLETSPVSGDARRDTSTGSVPVSEVDDTAQTQQEQSQMESAYKAVRKAYMYIPENLFPATTVGSSDFVWVYDSQGRVVRCNNLFFEYNDKGYVSKKYTKSTIVKPQEWTYEYQYAQNGKPSIMVSTYIGPNYFETETGDVVTSSYRYEGDHVVAIEEMTTRNGDVIREKTTHYAISYDENGKMSAIRWYSDVRPNFRYYIFFEYKNGTLTKTKYGLNELPQTEETYIQSSIDYNDNGEPVRLSFGGNGQYDQFYEYDENGSLSKLNGRTFAPPTVDKNGDLIDN